MAKVTAPSPATTTNQFTARVADLGARFGDADNSSLAGLFADFADIFPDAIAVTPYADLRKVFIAAYVATRGELDSDAQKRAEKTGANRWADLVAAVGYEKPQSAEQKKAAERMARTRAAKQPTAAAKDSGKGETPEVPVTGLSAADGVAVTLTRIDAHIITLLHAGRIAEAMKTINDTYAKQKA